MLKKDKGSEKCTLRAYWLMMMEEKVVCIKKSQQQQKAQL
jgi:hypothetical protein